MKFILFIGILFSSLLYSLELPLTFDQLTKTQKKAVIKNMKSLHYLYEYGFSNEDRKQLLFLNALLDDKETEKKYTEKELNILYDKEDALQNKYQIAFDKKVAKEKESSLIDSIRSKNNNLVKSLLKKGVNVNVKDKQGYSALHNAVYFGDNAQLVELLIKNGANKNVKYKGTPLIFFAIEQKAMKSIKALINAGVDVDTRNKDGETLLMKLSYNKELKPIKFLINAGANINAQAKDGSTALMNASYEGNVEVVKLLLKNTADVNLKTKKGNSALNFALDQKRNRVISLLIKAGTNLNQQDENGQTILMKSIQQQNYRFANLLLKQGADVNIRDNYGNLPLYYALNPLKYPKEKLDMEFVKSLLLKYGSNLNDVKSDIEFAKLIDEKNLVFIAISKNGKKYITRLNENSRMRSYPYQENHKNAYSSKTDLNNFPPTYTNDLGIEFVLIPKGSYTMGYSKKWSKYIMDGLAKDLKKTYVNNRIGDGMIERKVTINKPFYISKYEITQEQWSSLMKYNPSICLGYKKPVQLVSWNDINIFIDKLNKKEKTLKYRLPTEAEWEYVAWGGGDDKKEFKSTKKYLNKYAQIYDNMPLVGLNSKLKPNTNCGFNVGLKKSNYFGVYDMIGNVSEFVSDWYNPLENYNNNSDSPTGPKYGIYKTVKGCATTINKKQNITYGKLELCRPSLRSRISPTERRTSIGFRLAFSPDKKSVNSFFANNAIMKAKRSVFRLISTKLVDLNYIKNILPKVKYVFFKNNGWIITKKYGKFFKYKSKYYQQIGHGTAYTVSKEGVLVTNAHVVDKKYTHKDYNIDNVFLIESLTPYKLNPIKIIWTAWDNAKPKDISKNIRGITYINKPDIAIVKTANPLQYNIPLKFHIDGNNVNYYNNLGKMIYSIGFTGSYDDMHPEKKYLEQPKISTGELDGSTAYLNSQRANEGISSAVGSGGSSGAPIINICGEVIGTVLGGGSWNELEDLSGVKLMFEHLNVLLPFLDKYNVNYNIAKKRCYNFND